MVERTGERGPPRAAGFTLIEILAVIVIIGIVTAIAVISARALGGRSDQAQAATRLAGLIELASENARMENLQYGLKVKPHHYEFMVFNGRGSWLPLTKDPTLAGRDLPVGLTADVHTENPVAIPVVTTAPDAASAETGEGAPDEGTALTPQIAILSTGEITPFTLRLSSNNGKVWELRGTANGRVHVVPPGSVNGPNTILYNH